MAQKVYLCTHFSGSFMLRQSEIWYPVESNCLVHDFDQVNTCNSCDVSIGHLSSLGYCTLLYSNHACQVLKILRSNNNNSNNNGILLDY